MENWFESKLEGGVVQVHGSHRMGRLHGYQYSPHEIIAATHNKTQLPPSTLLTKHSLMSCRVIRRYTISAVDM